MLGGIAAAKAADTQRGAYLATIMDCGGCHTGGALERPARPGPCGWPGPTSGWACPVCGIFYPPNLTPEVATGLGR